MERSEAIPQLHEPLLGGTDLCHGGPGLVAPLEELVASFHEGQNPRVVERVVRQQHARVGEDGEEQDPEERQPRAERVGVRHDCVFPVFPVFPAS